MGIKELILNKGWAGRTLSRSETADRLDAVLRSLTTLMYAYDGAVPVLGDEVSSPILEAQKLLRGDIGKLSETILSAGAAAYTGVDQEAIRPDTDRPGDILESLAEQEEAFRSALDDEKTVEHQIRTRAVLENVARNSSDRLRLIRELSRTL